MARKRKNQLRRRKQKRMSVPTRTRGTSTVICPGMGSLAGTKTPKLLAISQFMKTQTRNQSKVLLV